METRITLGKIESLVGDMEVSHIGRATFGRKNPSSKVLTINMPNESRKVEMSDEAPFYNPLDGRFYEEVQREASIKYISCVESFLRKEGLYLAEAFYRPHGLFLEFPRSEKLEGELYRIKESK